MRKPIIAIDGYSSTGKSSISKALATELELVHIDTGALYRAITLYGLQHFSDGDNGIDIEQLLQHLSDIHLDLKNSDSQMILFMNGEDISIPIRTTEVSENVSHIAKEQAVRDFLLDTQRNIASKGGVIMDGRDIGTVVLPNADYKFFLTASIGERTKRRYRELISLGIESTEEEVRDNLLKRDKIDSEREVAPLKQAEDAILVDNSNMTKEETINKLLDYIRA